MAPILLLMTLAVGALDAGAQNRPQGTQLDSLRAEIALLRAQLDSLRSALAELSGPEAQAAQEIQEDALSRLRAAARAAAAAGAERDTTETGRGRQDETQFVGRQRSLQALNPEISLNGDVLGRIGDDPDSQNFVPREFEVSFQSALDPYSRAKIFVAYEEEGGGIEPFEGAEDPAHAGEGEGAAVHVEEAYAQWVNLPGGLGIKVGRFYQQFGTLNRWHSHALPFQTHSLPHLAFLGEEGLGQTGASFHWLVPLEGFGTWEVTGEVARASNHALFGESDGLTYLGHLNAFFELTPSTYLDLKGSAIVGDHEEEGETPFSSRLFGAELAVNWRPPHRALYREFTFRGGVMWRNPEAPPGEGLAQNALGLWSMAELRFARQWLVGGRFDWVENPLDTEESAWLVSPTLTWWQSEWVRLRAEYDHLDRGGETMGQLTLQITFAMGPHKHESY